MSIQFLIIEAQVDIQEKFRIVIETGLRENIAKDEERGQGIDPVVDLVLLGVELDTHIAVQDLTHEDVMVDLDLIAPCLHGGGILELERILKNQDAWEFLD